MTRLNKNIVVHQQVVALGLNTDAAGHKDCVIGPQE